MKLLLPTLAVLSATAAGAQAQNFSGLRSSYDARGEFQFGIFRATVTEAEITLRRDGEARIELKSRGNPFVWSGGQAPVLLGRWRPGGREVSVDLVSAWNQPAIGQARLRLDRDFRGTGEVEVQSIAVEGRLTGSGWNQGFRGQIEMAPQRDNRTRFNDLYVTKRGFGTLRLEGERDDTELRAAKIELARGGSAKITLEGRQNYIYDGTWRQTGRDLIALSLESAASLERRAPGTNRNGLGLDFNLGSGEIRLDGTSFRSLTLQGRRGDRRFQVEFSAQTRDSFERDNNGRRNDNWRRDDDWRDNNGRRNDNWRRDDDWRGNRNWSWSRN